MDRLNYWFWFKKKYVYIYIQNWDHFFCLGFDKDFVISVTSALVTSPFVNFNSSIACSLVNPFFVISLITFSGKGDGVGGNAAAAGRSDRC